MDIKRRPLSGSEIRARDKLALLAQIDQIGRLAAEQRKTANDICLMDLIKDICKTTKG